MKISGWQRLNAEYAKQFGGGDAQLASNRSQVLSACSGAGAGSEGGKVAFEGTPSELLKESKSLTGNHLAARLG